jgi:hypothetical protein
MVTQAKIILGPKIEAGANTFINIHWINKEDCPVLAIRLA